MNVTIEHLSFTRRLVIPKLVRDKLDLVFAFDTEYTQATPHKTVPLGLSVTPPVDLPGRGTAINRPLSYQWIVLDTVSGNQATCIYKPTVDEPRMNLGDMIRAGSRHFGFSSYALRRRKGQAPLRAAVVWHWGSAEMGLLADRNVIMDEKMPTLDLGGAVISTYPFALSVPLRDGNRNYGEAEVTLLDTFRLMDEGTSLEKLGDDLGIPKIDIEARGYDKGRMDILLEEDPVLFDAYALRDCEIAMEWFMQTATMQEQVLGLTKIATTTGSASADGVKEFYKTDFEQRFGCAYSRKRQEWTPSQKRNENESYVMNAFMGGMNTSYHLGHVHGTVLDLDFQGAYAAAMGVLPGIDWAADAARETRNQAATLKEALREPLSFVGVYFTFPKDTQFPCVPVYTEDHGPVYPLSNADNDTPTYVTGTELREAVAMGCVVQRIDSARIFKRKGLLVCDFLRYLTDLRKQYPKGTAQNLSAKLSINALSGKFGQGLAHKCTNDELFTEGELEADKKIKRCAVSMPHAGAFVMGLVRAGLNALVREASKVGMVLSATTDGAMVLLNSDQTKESALAAIIGGCEQHISIQALMEGRRNLGLVPGEWLEVKHEGNEACTLRTRMNWIGRDGQKVYEARVGFERNDKRPDYVPFAEIEQAWQAREPIYYTEERLNKISDVMEGRAQDTTSYYQTKKINLTPDWKRVFCEDGTSRPYKDMSEFWQYRKVARALGADAWPDNMHFQIQNGFVGPQMLENGVRKAILYRIANGAEGFRLPKGAKFEDVSRALGMNPKALSKARRERFAANDFPTRHPLVAAIQSQLKLW